MFWTLEDVRKEDLEALSLRRVDELFGGTYPMGWSIIKSRDGTKFDDKTRDKVKARGWRWVKPLFRYLHAHSPAVMLTQLKT